MRCSESHEALPCSRQPRGFVPTRLISIGTRACTLRLVESIAVPGPYATLSYCWGGAKPLSTTKANLAARLLHIPEYSLPVVFHQAIQLARKLKIPYIWIDSLCIIQDSVEDWEAESQKMSLYYKNGSINIAAGTSDNPDTPFTMHVDDMWCPISVKIHDSTGTPSRINIRRVPRLVHSNRDLGTLFTRAWAFQESLFAPRTINFTPQGVVWSCCCEDTLSDNYLDPQTEGVLRPVSELLALSQNSITHVGRSEKPGLDLWRELILYYSSRFLTFPMDRLPAISGAAAQFYEHLHCPYLAGHWYDDLAQSLVWNVRDVRQSRVTPLPKEYIAPSWSWASIPQPVAYPTISIDSNRILSSAAKTVQVHCEVAGTNPYGRVSSGFIDLRGKTVSIAIVMLKEISTTTTPEWDFQPDSPLTKSGDSVARAFIGETITDFEASACCLYLTSLTEPGDSYTRLESKACPLTTHYALALGWTAREQTSSIRLGLMKSTSARAMELFDGAVEKTVRII